MSKMITVNINGKHLTVGAGTRIAELITRAPHDGALPPLGAIINNRVDGLHCAVKNDSEIKTIDISRREGMDIYRRTAATVLYAAFLDIAPDAHIEVGQSISSGYFFEVDNCTIDSEFIDRLSKRMREIVADDIPMEPEWTSVEEAAVLFEKNGDHEKVKLLKQLRRSEIPVVTLGKYSGYSHGPIGCRTGLIDTFGLHLYQHGIVLEFPDDKGILAGKVPPQPTLFNSYLETKRWNGLVGVRNVADLNEICMRGGASDLVMVSEALHEKKIAAIADEIAKRSDTRLVLIAGPSSSGKTTFTKRLAIHLKVHGLEPVAISMDHYYRDREETPRHADGSFDFECIEALDVPLFNDHMHRLMQGQEIRIPFFSFATGRRDPARERPLILKKRQILITEGIHGLNEQLTAAVPSENKFKVYVSALTQLALDDHNRIFTTDTRLCRRIIRDRLFRNTPAAATIAGWGSVRAGEGKYIFPFQEGADVIFNSALPYEHALLKPYAERYLTEVPREHPSFVEASRLVRFFSFFIPILAMEVPHTSILREFVGGSAFSYK